MPRHSITHYYLLITLLLTSLACNTLLPPRPPIAWDPSATALIVESNKTFGMLYEPNAVPEARLWGDGQLVWVSTSSSGARQVLTATLTPAEMRTLLASIINAGFFGWDAHYSPGEVFDAPSTCLSVRLVADSHSVCETLTGAPRALHRLTDDLAAGAGFTGTPLVPASGFLSVVGLGPDLPTGAVAAEWPAQAAGQSLAGIAATPGQWLEGEMLALAWETTNAEPLNPLFHDGGNYYQVKLQVPNVTTSEPPENP